MGPQNALQPAEPPARSTGPNRRVALCEALAAAITGSTDGNRPAGLNGWRRTLRCALPGVDPRARETMRRMGGLPHQFRPDGKGHRGTTARRAVTRKISNRVHSIAVSYEWPCRVSRRFGARLAFEAMTTDPALSFGQAARDYDRFRPPYPARPRGTGSGNPAAGPSGRSGRGHRNPHPSPPGKGVLGGTGRTGRGDVDQLAAATPGASPLAGSARRSRSPTDQRTR